MVLNAGMDKILVRKNSDSGKCVKLPSSRDPGVAVSGASSSLILGDLSVFYLRQLAASLKVGHSPS